MLRKEISAKIVREAFLMACEYDGATVVRREEELVARNGGDDLISVAGTKIRVLSRRLKTAHVLVRTLMLLQFDAVGTMTNFGVQFT